MHDAPISLITDIRQTYYRDPLGVLRRVKQSFDRHTPILRARTSRTYARSHMYARSRAHLHVRSHVFTRTFPRIFARMFTRTLAHTRTRARVHSCVIPHVRARMYSYMRVRTLERTCACAHVHTCTCAHDAPKHAMHECSFIVFNCISLAYARAHSLYTVNGQVRVPVKSLNVFGYISYVILHVCFI